MGLGASCISLSKIRGSSSVSCERMLALLFSSILHSALHLGHCRNRMSYTVPANIRIPITQMMMLERMRKITTFKRKRPKGGNNNKCQTGDQKKPLIIHVMFKIKGNVFKDSIILIWPPYSLLESFNFSCFILCKIILKKEEKKTTPNPCKGHNEKDCVTVLLQAKFSIY